jgi:hypothetical protein
MKSRNFERATVAIALIVAMLTPFGTCVQVKGKAAHSCCAAASEDGGAVKANCCVVRDQQLAVIVVPSLPNPAPMAVAPEYSAKNLLTSSRELLVAIFIPPLSPPTGAFSLRI